MCIRDSNSDNSIAESVAIKDGSIIFVGSNEEIEPYKCNAEIMDLSDAFIYPGFIDSHVHLKATGYREPVSYTHLTLPTILRV